MDQFVEGIIFVNFVVTHVHDRAELLPVLIGVEEEHSVAVDDLPSQFALYGEGGTKFYQTIGTNVKCKFTTFSGLYFFATRCAKNKFPTVSTQTSLKTFSMYIFRINYVNGVQNFISFIVCSEIRKFAHPSWLSWFPQSSRRPPSPWPWPSACCSWGRSRVRWARYLRIRRGFCE